MPINIVLHEPEIPQNTGNIVRTCAATGANLHLIEPLGFSINDKYLKRAGLDYWEDVNISVYKNLDDFFSKNSAAAFYYVTVKAEKNYTDVEVTENCFLMFGKETMGLPEDLLIKNYSNCIRIPMLAGARSLNLSNSVAIIVYDFLRRDGFRTLKKSNKPAHFPA
ncbi:MAG: tRNA (uridine(34)/cytosine(34)/5-carboxymethylaminomethyluridine(34)-2'-O)-methyltransferase TrmL [Spirochaetes bacterium]|nr:tRNA (uridine(34)/cytosine(34)/5-carboxymethylaminomethyluridine(34)-2'-O)-methyltransferase TrmL [Spirochaetota bacterium]